jgi:hypothetical protein
MSIAGTSLGTNANAGPAGVIGLPPVAASGLTSEKSVWASISLKERVEWVARFRQLVAFHQPRLCELICEETRKPAHEALLTDVAPLLATCKWIEKNAGRLLRDRELSDGESGDHRDVELSGAAFGHSVGACTGHGQHGGGKAQ